MFMAKIYYIGDWAVQLGPTYAETPFNYANKGTVVINYGKWLKSAIESGGEHQVDSVPHWGCNFVFWKEYNHFWLNICNWLLD
jgi:uncharacterized membrane protein